VDNFYAIRNIRAGSAHNLTKVVQTVKKKTSHNIEQYLYSFEIFLETFAFLRVEMNQNTITKCLEILKIFSKNSNSFYIVIHFVGGIRTHSL
jgi:hypothetical protein